MEQAGATGLTETQDAGKAGMGSGREVPTRSFVVCRHLSGRGTHEGDHSIAS